MYLFKYHVMLCYAMLCYVKYIADIYRQETRHHEISRAIHPPRSLPASTAGPVPPCEWRHLQGKNWWIGSLKKVDVHKLVLESSKNTIKMSDR